MSWDPGPRRRNSPTVCLPTLLPLLSLLLAVTGCSGPVAKPDLASYNLLVVTIDTLRSDRLGSYGYAQAQTPNLDRLARDGIRFEEVYSTVPLTLPTHTTIFTGKYPFATGVRINGTHYVRDSEVTLAELFQAQSFDTAAFISAYVLVAKFGLDQGFDSYEDSLGMGDLFRFYSEIRADEVHRRFSNWLSSRRSKTDERFFGWIHFYDPHLPYEPPPNWATQFADRPYDGEIAFVDQQIGKLIDDLEAADLLDSTLLVVTSDHGEAFGEHVEEGHGLLTYNETLRVPLIFHAPGALPGNRVIRDSVGLIDLAPTLMELFDLAAPPGLHGRSLVPLLSGRQSTPDEPGSDLYFESLAGVEEKNWAPRTGLIANNHKLIQVPVPELYDLKQDPGETDNLFQTERELATDLSRRLDRLLESGTNEASSTRELSAEDRRQLAALGYVSSVGGASEVLDPVRGIEIEMKTRQVRTLLQQGELGQAEELLKAVQADHPGIEVADFYELRHELRAEGGDPAGAIEALEIGRRLFSRGALSLKLASYRFEIGNLEEAEKLCTEILELDPRLSQAISLRGMIAEKRGDPRGALGHFERALEVEPRSIPLQLRIANAQAQLGETSQALATYERLVDSGALDKNAEALYRTATLNGIAGNLPRAEELFLRGLAVEPAGRHHLALAMIQFRAGKANSAAETIEIALNRFRQELSSQEILLAETLLRRTRG